MTIDSILKDSAVLKIEPGENYLIFVNHDSIDLSAIQSFCAEPRDKENDFDATFIFVAVPPNATITDCIAAEKSNAIERAIAQERERCAKVAATYFEWHNPEHKEYCDGDPAGDIAAKIREGA